METSIIGWWFTIEPYVYIGLTSECVLLYNTLDGEYIESNKVEIIQLLKKLLERNNQGVVYLTKERDDALKFLAIRGCQDILTVEVLIDSEKVEETFDHSLQFFKCKAFGYKGDIKPCEMINFFRCQL